MKKSKILEITKTRLREWPNGNLYYITLRLENGEYITLGKKKEDAFSVGQEVSYTETVDSNGKKKWSEPKKSYGGWGITNRQIAAIGGAIISASGKGDFKSSAEAILSWLES